MKIALLSWESIHSIPVGGVAAHVTELAAALERRGHEVHVFTRLGEGQRPYERIARVHYHRCPCASDPDFVREINNMGNSFIYFLGETEAYQNAPFDIIHGHDWLCAKAIVQAKNDRGARTVLTMHSTEFGRCGNQHHGGLSERIRAVEYEGTYVADRVISVSAALDEEIATEYAVPKWKRRIVHNGIDCKRFDHPTNTARCRSSYGVGAHDPMLLFVGRLCTQKGPDILLDAVPGILQRHADTKVVFVGEGDMRRQLEHRAHEMKLDHALRFTGAMQPNGGIADIFKSADAVCVPSRNEPFGIVVLEAWAAGKPVIATRNGGPRDFVSHGRDGFLVTDNSKDISSSVGEMFGDFKRARRMGRRGRAKVTRSFGWDSIAEKTEAIYHEIL